MSSRSSESRFRGNRGFMKCRRCGGVALYRLFRTRPPLVRVVRCPRCGVFLYVEDGSISETPFRSYREAVAEAVAVAIAFGEYSD